MQRTSATWLLVVFAVTGLSTDVALADAQSPLFPADPLLAVPLEVELHLPLARLNKLRANDSQEFDGYLKLADGTELPLEVSPRGKSRRKQCSFAPIRLDFKKKSVKGTLFEGQNKLKLVTHCSSRLARGGYLAAEMLAYRLLNMLTDASFRVRSLKVAYVDTDSGRRETWPAFVIEHKSDLAKRLGGELLEVDTLQVNQLQSHYATLASMFALMVANTDFSLRMGPDEDCCHNAVPIQVEQVLSVPYDFDATGLVNAPYAKPSPAVKIRRVTQRTYRGYCGHNASVPGVAKEFLAKQADILALVDNFADIPGLDRPRVKKYLGEFFPLISSSKSLNSKLIKRCR